MGCDFLQIIFFIIIFKLLCMFGVLARLAHRYDSGRLNKKRTADFVDTYFKSSHLVNVALRYMFSSIIMVVLEEKIIGYKRT